jgi:hypothetical protein
MERTSNMLLDYHRNYLTFGILLSLALLVQGIRDLQPLRFDFRPWLTQQRSSVNPHHLQGLLRRAKITAQPAAKKHPVAARPAKQQLAQRERRLLNSSTQPYIYHFTGTIYCIDHPCASDIQISLAGEHARVLRKVRSTSEGDYHVSIPLTESPNTPIDWTLQIRTASDRISEVQGRHILGDDTSITIDRPITIL